ncbi:hypothetical protein [Streptomyces sp. B6B3]|uniref:pectate lyase family protein n=1 Tax=Streptomyces sp. B6B3 TaxID=3153570 RepID=UPI00325EBF71
MKLRELLFRQRSVTAIIGTVVASIAAMGLTTVNGATAAPALACDEELQGWATVEGNGLSTTTGGGDATPQVITTLEELEQYGGDATPRVLVVSGTITTGSYAVDIASNKTLVGADENATIHGGINIREGSSNIIVRNLNFHGFWPDPGPDDTIAARGAHHLWFDHLNVWNAGDGLMDLTQGSDFITVSWSKFWYTDTSHDHRLASLVGSDASPDQDATDAGKLNVTYHHNWFAEAVDQRMPRILFGKGHVFNNYYTSTDNGYAVGVGALASVLIENNYFKDVNNPHQFMYVRPSYITAEGNIYDDTSGVQDTGAGGEGGGVTPFTDPPYDYTLDDADDLPKTVSGCAGPTLSLI